MEADSLYLTVPIRSVTFMALPGTAPFIVTTSASPDRWPTCILGYRVLDLEQVLDESVLHFCYPAGDYDARVRQAVVQAGYRSALTCNRGVALGADAPLQLPRKAISFGDSVAGFGWKLFRSKRISTV